MIIMKLQRIIVLLVIGAMLLSCAALQKEHAKTFGLEGCWFLTALNGQLFDNKEGTAAPNLEIKMAEQKVFIQGTCNKFSGNIVQKDTNALVIRDLIGTKMFCDDIAVERTYTEALKKTVRYNLKDKNLTFYNAENKAIIQFKRAE
jgi:heat shock protein HslJ